MAKKFFSPSLSSILVLAKVFEVLLSTATLVTLSFFYQFACDFMLLHFPQDKPHVQNFFQTLIQRGKRDVSSLP